MILQAGYDCWITQSGDVPAKSRVFLKNTVVRDSAEFAKWKEITSRQKDEMVLMGALLDTSGMDYKAIARAEDVIRKVQDGIREHINGADLTDNEALEKKDWFPTWEHVRGVEVLPGFRLTFGGTLYEVTERHTVSVEERPGESVLYKVVTETVYGTEENPYKYEKGMTLEKGKYYTEYGEVYECLFENVRAYGADLRRLAEKGYVRLAGLPEEKPAEAEPGTRDNPLAYEKGTELEAGRYYVQDGVLYECVLSSDAVQSDLRDLPDFVREVR